MGESECLAFYLAAPEPQMVFEIYVSVNSTYIKGYSTDISGYTQTIDRTKGTQVTA